MNDDQSAGIPVPPSRPLQTAADSIRAAFCFAARTTMLLAYCTISALVIWAAEYHAKNGTLPDLAVVGQILSTLF